MRLSQLIVLGVLLGLGAGWWLRRDAGEPVAVALPATPPAAVTAAPVKPAAPARVDAAAPALTLASPGADAPAGLLLPVQGIQPSQLRDTFTDARSEGRVHDAIDIMADAGTPVLAVADGTVEKLFDSERGGLTIYQFEPSGRWCYYYAHLQRYADGLAEKQVIKRGEVIGYVGSTGNASAEAPHLHFEVHVLGPEKQWWKGESINPYPLLQAAGR
ncbi:endopeptidase [Stenotrophomonas sp. ZAC14D1_NAIMI4_6]|uniref:M23 family metallopeptidase n=1 Tax=unclassified Stenotrophomonas maltophilia group TaxID=2961925 RepID=UPI000D5420FE|nr:MULTISPECIES: M23 family metallopeptidase [unclassified Stenotrophomonas maltophilia group]AWH38094.1 endopeptidase [Stenotrophomonas sp. ZAC14D1_NAIMI4_6]AWH42225.1 endopeptidase [Stenotrophomonas sp. ZAC14D1_NAIMI4_1]